MHKKTSKLEASSSREAPNIKAQILSRRPRLSGAWCLMFLWSLLLGAWCFTLLASDQPQWGQAWSRNMVSSELGLPDSFDPKTGQNIKWSAELGTETHSTPIVAGGRVYIGTNNGHRRDAQQQGDRGLVMCFDE